MLFWFIKKRKVVAKLPMLSDSIELLSSKTGKTTGMGIIEAIDYDGITIRKRQTFMILKVDDKPLYYKLNKQIYKTW